MHIEIAPIELYMYTSVRAFKHAVTVGSSSSECPFFPSKGIKFCVRTLRNCIDVKSSMDMHTSAHMHARACTHTEVSVGSRNSDCLLLAVGSSDFSLLAVASSDFSLQTVASSDYWQ